MPFDLNTLRRGDIVLANLKGAIGTERNGKDIVCLIVQNDVGNKFSPMTIIVPLTDSNQNKKLPIQVPITSKERGNNGNDSIIECGQIRTIDKSRISVVISRLPEHIMKKVDQAIKISLGIL
ncbi:MAG: type II toxin-antitoxin system PemK/MazF family toxin [Acetobacter syzygii]|jgi:mRNA interferase MazF|uniref:type II toxin-antitoxin system PemK/MazF family toxin n=1 Tax=Acetobacter TaxID=434 RepID=UPI002430EEDF|nr:type II toxin-antitoxin system PemK/MazF family toxin [Acetobacter syzygii]